MANDGGPAFPTNAINHSGFQGMSFRDEAAIAAMQAFIEREGMAGQTGFLNAPYEKVNAGWCLDAAQALTDARQRRLDDERQQEMKP